MECNLDLADCLRINLSKDLLHQYEKVSTGKKAKDIQKSIQGLELISTFCNCQETLKNTKTHKSLTELEKEAKDIRIRTYRPVIKPYPGPKTETIFTYR